MQYRVMMFSWAPLLVMAPVQCTACTPLSVALPFTLYTVPPAISNTQVYMCF